LTDVPRVGIVSLAFGPTMSITVRIPEDHNLLPLDSATIVEIRAGCGVSSIDARHRRFILHLEDVPQERRSEIRQRILEMGLEIEGESPR
jgi:hypothetical protein